MKVYRFIGQILTKIFEGLSSVKEKLRMDYAGGGKSKLLTFSP